MKNVDKHEMRQSVFIDNTSFLLSSIFGLFPQVLYSDKDSIKIIDTLNNYSRFVIAVENADTIYRMLFMFSKHAAHLQALQSRIIPDVCGEPLFHLDKDYVFLKDFWYNIAAVYMFSFLDNIGCIGDSTIYNDLPVEMSQSECCAYFTSDAIPIVMGSEKTSDASMNNGIMYISMVL